LLGGIRYAPIEVGNGAHPTAAGKNWLPNLAELRCTAIEAGFRTLLWRFHRLKRSHVAANAIRREGPSALERRCTIDLFQEAKCPTLEALEAIEHQLKAQ